MYSSSINLLKDILEWLFFTPYGLFTVLFLALFSMAAWGLYYLGDIIRNFNKALKIDREERP